MRDYEVIVSGHSTTSPPAAIYSAMRDIFDHLLEIISLILHHLAERSPREVHEQPLRNPMVNVWCVM